MDINTAVNERIINKIMTAKMARIKDMKIKRRQNVIDEQIFHKLCLDLDTIVC